MWQRQSLMRFCIWLARESNKIKRCTAFRAMHLFIYSFLPSICALYFLPTSTDGRGHPREIAAIPNLFRIESIALSAFWARSFCLLGKKEICSASSFVTLVREIPNRRKGVRLSQSSAKSFFAVLNISEVMSVGSESFIWCDLFLNMLSRIVTPRHTALAPSALILDYTLSARASRMRLALSVVFTSSSKVVETLYPFASSGSARTGEESMPLA